MKLYDLFEQQKPLNPIQTYSSQGEFIDKGVGAYNSGGLPMLYRYIENQLGFTKKDVEKDFLPTKAEHTREEDAVMAFLGELESMAVEGKNSPKQVNPVAKHSRNKSGAGAHKSPKDYDRKDAKKDIKQQLGEKGDMMIGEPDAYYDAEERRQAYNDLQDALERSSNIEAMYVKDGHCPECPNVEDDEDCYGFGNYGCDDGILTYNNDDVSWKEIQDHDERQAQRQSAKDNYPGDEEVIKGLANMMKNMDDPRQAYQQMQADYPHMGRAERSSLIAKAKEMAFPNESFDVSAEQSREEEAYDELMDALHKGGEEAYAKACGLSMKELDQEMTEIGIDLNLHMDDDRDEIIQRHAEDTVDNADWKDHGEEDLEEDVLDGYYLAHRAKKLWLKDNPGKTERDYWRAGVDVQDEYTEKAGGIKGDYLGKGVSNWTVEEDMDSSEADVSKMLAKALGDPNKWSEMTAPELYAELESRDTEFADAIKQVAKIVYGVKLEEHRDN